MRRTFLYILLSISLMLAAGYYLNPSLTQAPLPVDSQGDELPRTYLKSARAWSYDKSGTLTDIVEADSAHYFASMDKSLLDKPRFFSHHGDDKTWSAYADNGLLFHEKRILQLKTNVVLLNDQTQGRMATEAMNIDTTRQIARTEVPVTISERDNEIRADRMVANLKAERIRLHGNVESIYVIPEKAP